MFNSGPVVALVSLGIPPLLIGALVALVACAPQRDDFDSRRAAAVIGGSLVGWFALALLAGYYVSLDFPLFLPFAVLPIAFITWSSFRPFLTRVLSAVPVHWLVYIQVYRVAGAVFLYVYATGGELSRDFAINAGWGDVLTGVLALGVGWVVTGRHRYAATALVCFCAIGIGDLLLPPASARIWGAEAVLSFPLNLIPIFLGPPLGISLHILSLRAYALQRGFRSSSQPLSTS